MDDYEDISKTERKTSPFASSLNTSKTKMESVSLSSLTAKYNRTLKGPALSSSKVGVAQKCSPVSTRSSSDDDYSDSDFSGSSLAALLVKHKVNNKETGKPLTNCEPKSISKLEKTFTPSHGMLRDSGDDSFSDSDNPSLLKLINTNQKSSLPRHHDPTAQSMDCSGSNAVNQDCSAGTNICQSEIKGTIKLPSCNLHCEMESKVKVEEVVSKFRKISFSDSDSDEPFSLSDLARKHTQSISQVDSGSADNLKNLKPKEILNVINSQRQHTKSESDSFTTPTSTTFNELMKKGFDNQTSTSLDCLGDKFSSKEGFQFSLGCKLPISYKTNKIGNHLYSSLSCIKASKLNTNSNNSFSDSDIRQYKCGNTIPQNSSSESQTQSVGNGQFPSVSINLSTAIKSSSSTKTDLSIPEDKGEELHDIQCDEIVTLLDTMVVDEEIDKEAQDGNCERPSFNTKTYEKCSFDASDLLKVKLKLKTTKCSMFGKIVCRRWKTLRTPYIKNEKKIVTTVLPFQFTTLSPDDQTRYFLNRRHPQ